MSEPVRVVAVPCPFGVGSVTYVYYLDTPEPALIDTGVAASPAGVIEPALHAAGFRLEDVRWILATHGHFDHIGGAHAVHEITSQPAQVAIHGADAEWLRDTRPAVHRDGYMGLRFRYIDDPAALATTDAVLLENISGSLGADRELTEGDQVSLGGGITIRVVHTPGHSPGSSTYLLEGANWAFCGDAVQVTGSSGNKFPLFVDPVAYRASLERLLNDVRPAELYLGHRFRDLDGTPFESHLSGDEVTSALRQSLEFERRLSEVSTQIAAKPTVAADFAAAATALGYDPQQPNTWPPSFLSTLGGYRPRD